MKRKEINMATWTPTFPSPPSSLYLPATFCSGYHTPTFPTPTFPSPSSLCLPATFCIGHGTTTFLSPSSTLHTSTAFLPVIQNNLLFTTNSEYTHPLLCSLSHTKFPFIITSSYPDHSHDPSSYNFPFTIISSYLNHLLYRLLYTHFPFIIVTLYTDQFLYPLS